LVSQKRRKKKKKGGPKQKREMGGPKKGWVWRKRKGKKIVAFLGEKKKKQNHTRFVKKKRGRGERVSSSICPGKKGPLGLKGGGRGRGLLTHILGRKRWKRRLQEEKGGVFP